MKKPMLAVACKTDKLQPNKKYYLQPKIDGIRVTIWDGVAYSRTLKPVPNRHIQKWVKQNEGLLQYLDGELVCGDPTAETCYRDTSSLVMSQDKLGEFTLLVFDKIEYSAKNTPFTTRYLAAESAAAILGELDNRIAIVPNTEVTLDTLAEAHKANVDLGYEGSMLRDPEMPYKHGRSTITKAELLKIKNFSDDEAIITGARELLHNMNEAYTNEVGATVHSSHKDNMRPGGTLGALETNWVNAKGEKVKLSIGTGFSAEHRQELWELHKKGQLTGRTIKFKYFDGGGYDAPRFPVFIGFRDKIDL